MNQVPRLVGTTQIYSGCWNSLGSSREAGRGDITPSLIQTGSRLRAEASRLAAEPGLWSRGSSLASCGPSRPITPPGSNGEFSGGPVVKTLLSLAGVACSLPDRKTKVSPALESKTQTVKQKQFCHKFHTDFKNGPRQKNLFKKF